MIPFNRPYSIGTEGVNTWELQNGKRFKYRCENYYHKLGVPLALMTTSCTAALEMAAMITCQPGDEVIMPSYTFVTSASAFIRAGAVPVFIDSREDHPGMDETKIEAAITDKTKAILVVHYAGVAADMDHIAKLANKYGLFIIEDAAQCWGAYHNGRLLGTIGDIGCISYHETKNIQCGEGGMILINNAAFTRDAQEVYHKGTNRVLFNRGMVNHYEWVRMGSSFAASEVSAAYLWSQITSADYIQNARKLIWKTYWQANAGKHPYIPTYATNNAHMYYVLTPNAAKVINDMARRGVMAVRHYRPLHKSPYFGSKVCLPNAERYAKQLIRLPLWPGLPLDQAIDAARKAIGNK